MILLAVAVHAEEPMITESVHSFAHLRRRPLALAVAAGTGSMVALGLAGWALTRPVVGHSPGLGRGHRRRQPEPDPAPRRRRGRADGALVALGVPGRQAPTAVLVYRAITFWRPPGSGHVVHHPR